MGTAPRGRWLVLAAFASLVSATQTLWLTFAPITSQAHAALGVSEGAIGDLAAVYPLVYVLLAIPTGRCQFSGRTVVTYTPDYSGEELDGRVVALGATPYRAATAETAVRLGRLLGHAVVMPRSLLRAYLSDSDRELATPRFGGPRLSLVTRVPTAAYWKGALPVVGRELGLSGVPAHP